MLEQRLFSPFGLFSYSLPGAALLMAALMYGAFGTPTPDVFGWVEALVGVLLIATCGWAGAAQFCLPARYRFEHAFTLWGGAVLLLIGLGAGHDLGAILRDFIPFLFLLLPVFLRPQLQKAEFRRVVCIAVVLIGGLFALRAQFSLKFLGESHALDYLVNMPTVLAAAILSGCYALDMACRRFSAQSWLGAAVLMGVSLFVLWPVIETTQRASAGLYVLALAVLWLYHFIVRPARAAALLLPFAAIVFIMWPDLRVILSAFIEKQSAVGGNMRLEELRAVWHHIDDHVFSALFGAGWGAHFESPAVGGLSVNFTHSLVSAFLLKGGLIGVLWLFVYLVRIVAGLRHVTFASLPIVLAVAIPILIDVFLYASYKSFDFGLILTLAVATGIYGDETRRKIASDDGLLYG